MLEYVEELKPVQTPKALELGVLYHRGLELLLHHKMDIKSIALVLEKEQRNACDERGVDYDPIPVGVATAMVCAFYKESNYKLWNIRKVEEKFEVSTGYGKRLIGKIDAIMELDGKDFLVEHKSTSQWGKDGGEYLHNLLWDEQSTNYLYAYREMYGKPAAGIMYCIVEKPLIKPLLATPPEKRKYKLDGTLYANQREVDETPEEYISRVLLWYAEAPRVHIHFVHRTPVEIDAQVEDLNLVFKDMAECEKNETYYRNPGACSIIDCPYRPKCLENAPDTDCLFVRKKAKNEELA
jgi:hypothetical protein